MRQMHALRMNLGRRPRNEYAGEGKREVSREWDIISRRGAEARNRPLRVGATHGEATKPSEARAERRGGGNDDRE